MKSLKSIIKYLIIIILFISCDNGIKKGSELTQTDLNYIQQIGLKDENENVILFASQLDNQTSGNLITDKRLASYWIDKQKEIKNVNSALYSEIDTILTKDLSNSLTYASYIKVVKKDNSEFKVHVDDNAKMTKKFFETAISEWKKRRE